MAWKCVEHDEDDGGDDDKAVDSDRIDLWPSLRKPSGFLNGFRNIELLIHFKFKWKSDTHHIDLNIDSNWIPFYTF